MVTSKACLYQRPLYLKGAHSHQLHNKVYIYVTCIVFNHYHSSFVSLFDELIMQVQLGPQNKHEESFVNKDKNLFR